MTARCIRPTGFVGRTFLRKHLQIDKMYDILILLISLLEVIL